MNPFNFTQQELYRDGHLLLAGLERMRNSGIAILGEGVHRFEQAFGQWLAAGGEAPEVIGVASGTDALELALRACGAGVGKRVLLPAHTAYATLAAVLRVGAEPTFVDVDPASPVLSACHLEELLRDYASKNAAMPRALIAVHLYGACCDLDAIEVVCDRYGIDLIEDCAQACGSHYRGRPVGTWGRFGAFSFYPTKNLAAFGDGGALVVNRREEASHVRRSRIYGWDEARQAVQFGINSRLDELQAWVLLGKLSSLDDRISERRRVARWYQERLQRLMDLPSDGENWLHSYHLFVIEVSDRQRDELVTAGNREGIPLAIHYPLACHQHPHVCQRFGTPPSLPNTECFVKRIVTLPLHPYLEENHVDSICQWITSHPLAADRIEEVRS
jgi:dTDP-4-amino-4,6-dideoxygalactose transaminase